MSKMYLMECNCVAQGTTKEGKPICLTHMERRIKREIPQLKDRLAKCMYGCKGSVTESSVTLPFFVYQPDNRYDQYYCGCYGWE